MTRVRYVSITARITRISESLKKAAPDILTYLFVFIIVFIAFCVCGFLVFGNDLQVRALVPSPPACCGRTFTR